MKRKILATILLSGMVLTGCTTIDNTTTTDSEVTQSPFQWIFHSNDDSEGKNVSASGTSSYYTDQESDHIYTDYADMHIEITYEEAYATITALEESLSQKDNRSQVQSDYETMMSAMDEYCTRYVLNNISYYANVSDEELSETNLALETSSISLCDEAYAVLSQLYDSEYNDILDQDFGDMKEELKDYEQMTDEEKALAEEESALVQEYDSLMVEEDISDSETYEKICEIYEELIAVRNQLKDCEGYDTYMEYAYENIYNRDYSIDDIMTYREYVKTYISPLITSYMDQLDYKALMKLYRMDAPDEDALLSTMETYIPMIHEELLGSFSYFKDCHLYDIAASDSKMEMGFTTMLYSYGLPFIFNSPYEDFSDYFTMFHEFGHFNAAFHSPTHVLCEANALDVSEIQSQGLELLFLHHAGDVFGENVAETVIDYQIICMLESIIDGCLYDEFMEITFDNPDYTADELSDLFDELLKEYGFSDWGLKGTDWIRVSHTFENPFYYISYSTSAMAALEIYAQSLEDMENGITTYMKISALNDTTTFLNALAESGLPNIFEEKNIEKVADLLK